MKIRRAQEGFAHASEHFRFFLVSVGIGWILYGIFVEVFNLKAMGGIAFEKSLNSLTSDT